MQEFNFELKKSVKYSYKGEDLEATFITLKEPSIDQLELVSFFQKAVLRCIKSMNTNESSQSTESANDDDAAKITAHQVLMILVQEYPDMKALFNTAKKLFYCVGIASVEGVVDFTHTIYKVMTISDFQNMMCEYLVNFILPSVLGQEN